MLMRLLRAALVAVLLSSATRAEADRVRLAVTDFSDASPQGSLAHLGKGLQSMLTTDLTAASAFDVIERARLADVLAELKLQQRKEIDEKTAVQIGKLLGASHLTSGSLTVLGDKMRIDCRLVAVDTGAVLLAEKVEGEKSAFFELEKTLAQKLVKSLGITVEPKQRALMAKVHTADFEAFQKFSEGVAQFDEKRYDDAVRALRTATQIDGEFKLAQITLAGYEELLKKARVAIVAADQEVEERKRLAHDKNAKVAAAIIDKLVAITRKGSPAERGLAFLFLARTYRGTQELGAPLDVVYENGDEFAHRRTGDNYYKAYWFAAQEAFPELPLVPYFKGRPPSSLASFEADFKSSLVAARAAARELSLDWDCYAIQEYRQLLQLDMCQGARLAERLTELESKFSPPPPIEKHGDHEIEVARFYRACLDLDRSTAHLLAAQKCCADPSLLRIVAMELETTRGLAKVLQEPSSYPQALRETLLGYNASASRAEVAAFADKPLSKPAMVSIWKVREWSVVRDRPLLIGAEPLWDFRTSPALHTGPRSGSDRATEIRYASAKEVSGATLVAGSAPATSFRLSFTASRELPNELREVPTEESGQPHQDFLDGIVLAKSESTWPSLGVLFGLKSLHYRARGGQGYALRFTETHVRLFKISATAPYGSIFAEQLLAEYPLKLGNPKQLQVEVALADGALEIKVNGQSCRAPAPADTRGFLGLSFDGTGYAGVSDLRIKR